MTGLWYPVTEQHPAPIVRVVGLVGTERARMLVSRGQRPHQSLWAAWNAGRVNPLPPGVRPTVWQPQEPAKWRAELPDPVDPMTCKPFGSAVIDDDQWWRDGHAIVYEAPGFVSRKMAEGRVMRAVAACRNSVTMPYARSFSSLMAEMATDAHDGVVTSDYILRFKPLRPDVQDFSTAMAWFAALNPPEMRSEKDPLAFNRQQKILAYRSDDVPWTYGKIGEKWSITADGARKFYGRVIDAVHRVANGMAPYAWVPTIDQMAALRERNRLARVG